MSLRPVPEEPEPRLLVSPSAGVSTGFLAATAFLLSLAGFAFFLLIRV